MVVSGNRDNEEKKISARAENKTNKVEIKFILAGIKWVRGRRNKDGRQEVGREIMMFQVTHKCL